MYHRLTTPDGREVVGTFGSQRAALEFVIGMAAEDGAGVGHLLVLERMNDADRNAQPHRARSEVKARARDPWLLGWFPLLRNRP